MLYSFTFSVIIRASEEGVIQWLHGLEEAGRWSKKAYVSLK